MKIVLFMAITPNGMVSREDGNEDFIPEGSWKEFVRIVNETGNLVWGRKTYENFIKWEGNYQNDLKSVKKYVLSSNPNLPVVGGFQLVTSIDQYLDKVKKEGFDVAMLIGGGKTNSEFMKRGLINEVILNVVPFVLGKGIPVFREEDFGLKLEFEGVSELGDGVLQLRYGVLK